MAEHYSYLYRTKLISEKQAFREVKWSWPKTGSWMVKLMHMSWNTNTLSKGLQYFFRLRIRHCTNKKYIILFAKLPRYVTT